VKERWEYSEELYLETNNLNMACNVIQELFWSYQERKPLPQCYAGFRKVYKELKMLFHISTDVKKMHTRVRS